MRDRKSRPQLGAVTWPGLIAVIVVLFTAVWLYQRHRANNAYGPVIVAQSISMAMMGRQQVEAAVLDSGELPRSADDAGFMSMDQKVGPSDRVVRLRLDMLEGGELKLRYDGWKFDGASLRLEPTIDGETLRWKCSSEGMPERWIRDWCFQIEQRTTAIGAPPDPRVAAAAAAAREAEASSSTQEWATWEPPFQSRGPLSADAAVIAEGLRNLEPFQQAAQEYFNDHNELPSSAAELEEKYTPEQLQLNIWGRLAEVRFGPVAIISLTFQGMSEPVSVHVTPMVSSTGGRLVWECRSDEGTTIDVPQECRAPSL